MKSKQARKGGAHQKVGRRAGKSFAVSEDRGIWLESWSALSEYLQCAPNMLIRIEVQDASYEKMLKMLQQYDCKIKPVVQSELLSPFRAELKIPEYSEMELLEALTDKEGPSLILALDQITDTRNLGAIARSAAYFGVTWLVMPRDRQAAITSGALASAQGAFAYVKPVYVTNLSRTLTNLKELGFWVLGTDMDGEPLNAVLGLYEKMVLVLGSEDRGMRSLTRKNCDRIIAIARQTQGVESLNVAVAAGIFLHQLSPIANSN